MLNPSPSRPAGRYPTAFSTSSLGWSLLLLLAGAATSQAGLQTVWQIGKPDNSNAEFALAPKGHTQFKDDGFFIVGQSDSRQDWPYVQPGPLDGWSGARPHTFTVIFGVASTPREGDAKLEFDLLDTQSKTPPELRVQVNGESFSLKTPKGAGDESIYGQPAKGREHKAEVAFPASLLKPGNNRIEITTVSGSWILYDSLSLNAPESVTSVAVAAFTELGEVKVSGTAGEQGAAPTQIIRATVLHAGPPTEAAFTLHGKPLRTTQLTAGRQMLEFPAPAVERARSAAFAMTIAGTTIAQRDVNLTPGVREIIVVFKTHFDIGYTDMASNVVKTYRTRFMDSALKVVEESRRLPSEQQFVWTIPGWPLTKIMEDWPGQTPERQQRVKQAVKEGRFVVHALPFTTHTELLEPEDLVRGLGYSSRIARELGLPLPRDAKMTDVPEHTAMLATLLKQAGVTFMHIGCNAMSGSPQVPPLYWWEGPDGSRVLTMYSPDYGTGLIPKSDWPYRTWLALLHTGDNHGPPRPEEVKKVLDQAAQQMPNVKVRIGRLSDFGDAILAENPDLTVVRADMPDTWIHGPMSDPAGARIARNTRPLIGATEALNTQLRAWNLAVPDASPTVAAAWEQSLLYGEHTWGGSIGWVQNRFAFGDDFKKERAAGRYARIEGSWDEHTAYIKQAQGLILPALEANLRSLAAAVKTNGQRIVVFNPLPWQRSGIVSLERPEAASFAALRDDAGSVLPTERNGAFLRFFARDIPPTGYRTYVPAKAELGPSPLRADADSATLESPSFKAMVDPKSGTVKSLTDKRSGREVVDAASPHGFGAFLYERFDNNQIWDYIHAYLKSPHWTIDFEKPGLPPADKAPYQSATPSHFKLRFEQSPVCVAAVMEAPVRGALPGAVTKRLILFRDEPFADLEITLHDKPFEPWPEAGWICLPFKVAEPQFRLGRLGNIIDPARDLVPGANRNIFGINTGVALFDPANAGAGFCPLDSPLVSLDTPGCWKFSKDFIPRKPVAYVNLFNNQWNTNFRLWNSGTWTWRVRIWSFDRFDPERDMIRPSLEARYALQASFANGSDGNLPVSQAGLALSHKGALVTAFGPNPDGAGTLLRLWELAGKSASCRVCLPAGLKAKSAQPVDLRGRPSGTALPVKDESFETPLRAFAPASFVLER